MNIEKGNIINGIVSGIVGYGVFVNFENGYRGLIHISEISNNYVKTIEDYVKLEDEIPCKILEVDHEKKKISCSIKDSDFIKNKEKEKDRGFQPLKENLPNWIDEKIAEMNKKTYDR